MKLSAFITAAAVIGGSFLIPNPAEARNGWIKAACGVGSDHCYYVKPLNKTNYPRVVYMSNGSQMLKKEGDCQKYKSRILWEDGTKGAWRDQMPDSVGWAALETVCR